MPRGGGKSAKYSSARTTRHTFRTNPTLHFLQDGSPYIQSVKAGKTFADQRAQGYTIAVMTTFASEEDFAFYDTQCEAHKELKAFAASVHQGNLMVYFHSALE
jgi:Stress responsive A/B Barrel Domain